MPTLDEARNILQRGDRIRARTILANMITLEPQNPAAWLLLAETLDDPQQIAFCRQRAQSISAIVQPPPAQPVEPLSPMPIQEPSAYPTSSMVKKCPYCAEEIRDEAIVCRYCGRDVREPKRNAATASGQVVMSQEEHKQLLKATKQTAQASKDAAKTLSTILSIVLLLIGCYILAVTLPGNPYYGCSSIFLPVILLVMRLTGR